ncbi:cell division protein MukB [Salmonella enterica subsp. enterica]|nr:cell division protein MukB [Salmonella enterica subsp. enterica]
MKIWQRASVSLPKKKWMQRVIYLLPGLMKGNNCEPLPLIRSLSIVNINGIMARTLNLVNPHALRTSRQYGGTVSLLGNNGAGKNVFVGRVYVSQIPDIRYISLGTKDDFKVSTSIKDSEMFPRLGQPSIVALEIEARGTGHRHCTSLGLKKRQEQH